MELLAPSIAFRTLLPASLRHGFGGCCLSRCLQVRCQWNRSSISKPLPTSVICVDKDDVSSIDEDPNAVCPNDKSGNWVGSEFVDVIGIGSRNDAVLDFCLASPFQSPSLRFWNIQTKDSPEVLLQERCLDKDITPRVMEAPPSPQSCSKAIILVAGAAYGSDHVTALDILRKTKAANGLAVGLVLKPFSFEGQRRQEEAKYLVDKFKEHTNFYAVIDMDTLLQKNLVTLDEALRTANNAVVLAINAMFVLVSEKHKKFIDVPHDDMKEVGLSHIIKIIESCKEAKVGFGAGYNIKTSIAQAIYDCPFLNVGMQSLNGSVICVIASSSAIDSNDMNSFVQTFRQTTECTREIVICGIEEPNLESNLIILTVLFLGCTVQQSSKKNSIFARLACHFPFVFNLLRKSDEVPEESQSHENPRDSEETNSTGSVEISNPIPMDSNAEDLYTHSEEPEGIQELHSNNNDQIHVSRSGMDKSEVEFAEDEFAAFDYDPCTEGALSFQREPLISWNLGPGHQVARQWAKERACSPGIAPVLDNPSICLPVGVSPEELKKGSKFSTMGPSNRISWGNMKVESAVTARMSLQDTLNHTLRKRKYGDAPKKNRMASVRAASMLEAERDSQRRWNPSVEIEYRGGVYTGRCQGGLPEGKGRLLLGDGSIYDGMWHYGMRAGIGTLYYSNGDVFKGSWRDDVMHGKGWYYFHTGDRWFTNFWKGKANGEGRFYSKSGDVFFGEFQDGLRHGNFLCITVDGVRFVEIWDDGVLVSRNQLDPDSSHG